MSATPRDSRELERGQVIVLFALSLVVMLGVLAVILDGGRVFTERRRVQNAADAAATAGAAVLNVTNISGTLTAVQQAACQAAGANGYGDGSVDATCGPTGTAVRVHVPGSSDGVGMLPGVLPQFEATGYVQVAVTSHFQPFVAGIFGYNNFAASALAVAVNIPNNGTGYALLVLDPIDCGSFFINGNNTTINVNGGVQVNSDAYHTKGSTSPCTSQNAATIKSASLQTTNGPNNVVGGGDPGATPNWTPGADYAPDPLTDVHVPPLSDTTAWATIPGQPGTATDPQNWNDSGTKTFPNPIPPGVVWGGITVNNNLVLQGGTYIMAGGGFNVSSGTVSAEGPVTLIYTVDPYCNSNNSGSCSPPSAKNRGDLPSTTGQSTGGSWGLSPTATLPPGVTTPQLQAPGEGCVWNPQTNAWDNCTTTRSTYSYLNKILIYVDRNVGPCQITSGAPNGDTNLTAGGNGSFYFDTGSIIYAPCGTVTLAGNGSSYGGATVAYNVKLSGTKYLNLGGPGTPTQNPSKSGLVQ